MGGALVKLIIQMCEVFLMWSMEFLGIAFIRGSIWSEAWPIYLIIAAVGAIVLGVFLALKERE